ncbi:wax ester/triacylglycerol synthase domain-containing protein [Streptomyces sp. WAC 01529]|uniref:wax ester/triacylglycerol synthase domain-containing protein n=1 Tax=Streptomyces sp. WAC 01529 TaxID=2203205 RepID=UPI001F0C354B|nr:wax ester/triacylglycerol synthase domain-containing protein [Streptomyces sp. WAC 01529]
MRLSFPDEALLLNGCPGVVGMAAVFKGEAPELREVRARVAERWTALRRMSQVLDTSNAPGTSDSPDSPGAPDSPDTSGVSGGDGRRAAHRRRAHWVVREPFRPATHVLAARHGLDDLWADVFDRPLPDGPPPWRLHVVPGGPEGGFALALVAQHVLLDGRSLETLLHALMDDIVPVRATGRPPLPRVRLGAVGRELKALTARGQALPTPSPHRTSPSIAVRTLSSDTFRAARRHPLGTRGATPNELLISAVAGALRAHFGPSPHWPGTRPVYTAVPCDLRARDNEHELGNGATAVQVALPLDVDDPVARLRVCRTSLQTVPARSGVHAAALLPWGETVKRVAPWTVARMADRAARPTFAATATTVLKWRDTSSAFQGSRLRHVVGLPPLHRPGSASFLLAQNNSACTLTVVCHLLPHSAQRLADAVVDEFEALARRQRKT